MAGYARCYPKNTELSAFGRVLVTADFRGEGLAKQLVQTAIDTCQQHWPERAITIGAQCYLVDFYQQFGFESVWVKITLKMEYHTKICVCSSHRATAKFVNLTVSLQTRVRWQWGIQT